MNHRLTHTLVGIVATGLVVATLAFGFVVTAYSRAGGPTPAARSAIPPITHPVNESMADCLRCHKVGQGGMPPSHATYGAGTCLTCHRVAQTSPVAPGEAVPTAQPAASTPLPEPAAIDGATSVPTAAAQAPE